MRGTRSERGEGFYDRLQELLDEREIEKLIIRYGFAVDSGDAEATMALFTEEAVYEVGAVGTGMADGSREPLIMTGQKAIGEMIKSPRHQSLLPGCAHTIGPIIIEVEGDHASATGYSRIYVLEEEGVRLFRLGINAWTLMKQEGHWRIAKRVSQILGTSEAQEILRQAARDPYLAE